MLDYTTVIGGAVLIGSEWGRTSRVINGGNDSEEILEHGEVYQARNSSDHVS